MAEEVMVVEAMAEDIANSVRAGVTVEVMVAVDMEAMEAMEEEEVQWLKCLFYIQSLRTFRQIGGCLTCGGGGGEGGGHGGGAAIIIKIKKKGSYGKLSMIIKNS